MKMLPDEFMREDEKIAPDGEAAQEIRWIMNGRLIVEYRRATGCRFFGIGHYAIVINEAASKCEVTPYGLNADADAAMSNLIRAGRANLIENQNFPIHADNVAEAFKVYADSFHAYRVRVGELQTQTMRMVREQQLAARMADAKGGKLVVQ